MRIISDRLVGKIITIIPSCRVGISKNNNIDYRVRKTCAIMSTQVIYETGHISLLPDSTMSSTLNFLFLCMLL